MSADAAYFTGARTTVNGAEGDNEQEIVRTGLTLSLPVNRQNSVKLNASTGLYTRTGSEFTALGVTWQFRW